MTEDTIDITPDYPRLLTWQATAMAGHAFERNAHSVMASIIEMAGYLARNEPERFNAVVEELRRRDPA